MQKTSRLSIAEKIALVGFPFVTVLVWTASTLDPVNLPKMLAVGVLAFALLPGIVHQFNLKEKQKSFFLLLVFFCVTWTFLSAFLSGSNTVQSVFGVSGRFTGAMTYLAFYLITVFVFLYNSRFFYERVFLSLCIAGIVNVIYCGWVILSGTDPIPWTNVYGNILGTFGNPNFISSFLGIFITVVFSKIVENKLSYKYQFLGCSLILVSFLEIIDSKSRQGVIVTAIGCGAIIFYKIKVSRLHSLVKFAVGGALISGGTLSILGMLQFGPLSSLIYKESVSIRGAYWRAGFETMLQNPFFGVGPDGFGDWYTRVRDARAMIVPGPDVFTNSPHNIFIEQGAIGGIPLFAGYLLIQVYVLLCGVRYFLKSKDFDFLFAASFFGWLGFTAQSIISINQIGLAIWGFILGGMTIGLYKVSLGSGNVYLNPTKPAKISSLYGEYQRLLVAIGASVGMALYLPPFVSDANWRSALESKNLENIVAAADRWPQSTDRYIEVTKALYENKFLDESLTFARKGISFNPNSARLWYFLYQLPGSTSQEKKKALDKLKVLDPNFVVK